ncbi:MAG: BtpA/SgcQ family protein [Planctomycetota bacterium]
MNVWTRQVLGDQKAVVGMLHAPALPGSPGYDGDFSAVIDTVRRDAAAWIEGGLSHHPKTSGDRLASGFWGGLMLENFGDVPFYRGRVPSEVVACLTRLAVEVKREIGDAVPLGINVLRNDGESALAVAAASGADYVRVNVLSGAVVTDQGLVEGDAARLMRRRREMGAERVSVWADVRVKHASPLGAGWRPIEEEVEELVLRAGASGVIVSGSGTGKATDLDELRAVRNVMDHLGSKTVPIWVGSGASAKTAAALLEHADGLIVGTSVKTGGRLDAPVDPTRVKALLDAIAAFQYP